MYSTWTVVQERRMHVHRLTQCEREHGVLAIPLFLWSQLIPVNVNLRVSVHLPLKSIHILWDVSNAIWQKIVHFVKFGFPLTSQHQEVLFNHNSINDYSLALRLFWPVDKVEIEVQYSYLCTFLNIPLWLCMLQHKRKCCWQWPIFGVCV